MITSLPYGWVICFLLETTVIPSASAASIARSPTAGASTLGLPAVDDTVEQPLAPAKVELGGRLFFDPRLSHDGTISCARCHMPERAFSDGRRVAQGTEGQPGTRNTPSLLNVVFKMTEFWDGRRSSLEAQALDPLTNPLEHGLKDENELMDRIRLDPTYLAEFRAAFGFRAPL
jgi:cytochrome c peroxidase